MKNKRTNGRNDRPKTMGEIFNKFEGVNLYNELSQNTIALYRATAFKFCLWVDDQPIKPNELESADVLNYLIDLKRRDGQPYAYSSRRAHARDIRNLLNFAAEYQYIPAPLKVEVPKERNGTVEYLSDEEQKQLGHELINWTPRDRDQSIIWLIVESGIRRSELCALSWADISWNEADQLGSVQIRNGKGGKDRETYFQKQTWQLLKNYRDWFPFRDPHNPDSWVNKQPIPELYRDEKTRPVFWSLQKRQRLHPRGLDHVLKKFCEFSIEFNERNPELNKVPLEIKAHKLRHTCGRNLAKQGLPPQAIMEILGHSSLKMVEHYTKLVKADVRDLVKRLVNGID